MKILFGLFALVYLTNGLLSVPRINHTAPRYDSMIPQLITNETLKNPSLNNSLQCMAALYQLQQTENLISTLMNSAHGFNDLGEWRNCQRLPTKRYMAVTISITDYIPLSFQGFCGPVECQQEDYTVVFQTITPTLESVFTGMFGANMTGKVFLMAYDSTKGIPDNKVDGWEIATWTFLGIMGTIVFATSVGYFVKSLLPVKKIKEPNTASSISDSSPTTQLLINEDENNKSVVHQNGNTNGTNGTNGARNGHGRENGESKPKRLTIWEKFTGAFALQNNFKKLFPDEEFADPQLSVFHGIRFFSMFWVVWGHQYQLRMSAASNMLDIPPFLKGSWMVMVFGGEFSVDVFLFMGGFFFAYVAYRKLTIKDVNIGSYVYMIVHRIWRIWPVMFLSLGFLWKIAKYIPSGPVSGLMAGFTNDQCKEYYWEILLFMQTLDRRNGNNCFPWSWYLACDMQIFLLMPIIAFLYIKNKTASRILCAVLTFATMVYCFILSYKNDFTPQSLLTDPDGTYHWWYYYPPWARLPPYTIGVLVCDWYLTNKNTPKDEQPQFIQKLRNSAATQWFCTFLGFLVMAFLVYCVEPTFMNPHAFTKFENALYIALSRPLYIMGLTLFISPALIGEGKWLIAVLGNKAFSALAKLTFSMYLIHATILAIDVFSSGRFRHMDHPAVFADAVAMCFVVFLASMPVYLCIELPLANLETYFLRGGAAPRGKKPAGEVKDKDTKGIKGEVSK